MGGRVVPELVDERVPLQGLLHDAPLNALAPAVHEPQFAEPLSVRRLPFSVRSLATAPNPTACNTTANGKVTQPYTNPRTSTLRFSF